MQTLGSSLHCACYKLNIGMAELLLERGADTNLTNQVPNKFLSGCFLRTEYSQANCHLTIWTSETSPLFRYECGGYNLVSSVSFRLIKLVADAYRVGKHDTASY